MSRQNQKGFTLIELLVVISIIAMLASIIFASLNTARTRAEQVVLMQNFHELRNGLELYRDDNGTYPTGNYMSLDAPGWNSGLGTKLKPYLGTVPPGTSQATLYYQYVGPYSIVVPFGGSTCVNTGDGFYLYTMGTFYPPEAANDGGWSAAHLELLGGSSIKC